MIMYLTCALWGIFTLGMLFEAFETNGHKAKPHEDTIASAALFAVVYSFVGIIGAVFG